MSCREQLAIAAHRAAMALMDLGLWLRRQRRPPDFRDLPRNVHAGLAADRKAWLDEFARLMPDALVEPAGPGIDLVVAMVGDQPCAWRIGETTPGQAAAGLRIELSSNPEQFDSQPAILDDPRMGGVTCARGSRERTWRTGMDALRPGGTWRPAIWAELDEA